MKSKIKQSRALIHICNQIVHHQLKNIDTSILVPSDEVLLPILEMVWDCRRNHGLNEVMVKWYILKDVKKAIYSQRCRNKKKLLPKKKIKKKN